MIWAVAVAITFVISTGMLALLYQAVRGHAGVRDLSAVARTAVPLDLAAFENLIDPAQARFLKTQMPARRYRQVERLRLQTIRAYVKIAAHNAAVLLSVGEALREAADPEVARHAAELATRAMQFRMNCLLALFRLTARIYLPLGDERLGTMLEAYRALTDECRSVGQLQDPQGAAAVFSSLAN